MTTYTIKQALATTPEQLATMSLDDVQAVADALATSTDRKALRKLDLVQGTLEARRKGAKQSGDKELQAEVKAVENSVKMQRKPKVVKELPIEEEEQDEEEENEEPMTDAESREETLQALNLAALKKIAKDNKITVPKIIKKDALIAKILEALEEAEAEVKAEVKAPTPKPQPRPKNAKPKTELTDMQVMQKKMQELEKENAKLKAEVFPSIIEREGKAPLVAQAYENVQDIQALLISRPLELFLYAHEGLDEKPTAFTVLFMNEEILVLLDRSRTLNSTLTLSTKKMTKKSVQIDKRDCPFTFYLTEKK